MKTRTPRRVSAASTQVGANVQTWRKLLRLTAEELADRAGISVPTLRRIETGHPGVAFESVARVLLILGQLEPVVQATDPFTTDLGRARAGQTLPERVHRPRVR